jgi:hypothetical protein
MRNGKWKIIRLPVNAVRHHFAATLTLKVTLTIFSIQKHGGNDLFILHPLFERA